MVVNIIPHNRGVKTCFHNVKTENRQDFSHREAEEKSLLDEALRRGSGSVDGWGGMVVARRVAGMVGWPECLGFESAGAQHFRSRVLGGWKTRFSSDDIHVFARRIHVSMYAAEPLWHAGLRPLAEKHRPRAAAVGTTWAVGVVVALVDHALVVVDGDKLTQCFQQVRDLRQAACVGRLLEDQQQPRATGQVALRVVP